MESLYSMDGDRAPLDALAAIAEHHDAFLVVDEAHATGVFGPEGRGLATALEGRRNVIVVHTCSKASAAPARSSRSPRTRRLPGESLSPLIFGTAPSP